MNAMKKLIIIGARNFGREVYSLAKQCSENGKDWVIAGFLDSNPEKIDSLDYPVKILGAVETYQPTKEDLFVCAVGEPKHKKSYVSIIEARGGIFINLIHPTVIVNDNLTLGKGIIVQPYCILSNDVRIDDFVTIQSYSTIGHDSHCEAYCHLSAYTFLGGFSKVGKSVFTGTRATILPKTKVGNSSRVGANSLVIRDVPQDISVFGNPAVKICSST